MMHRGIASPVETLLLLRVHLLTIAHSLGRVAETCLLLLLLLLACYFVSFFLFLNFLVNLGDFQRSFLLSPSLPIIVTEKDDFFNREAHARVEGFIFRKLQHSLEVCLEVLRLLGVRFLFKGLSYGRQELAQQFNILFKKFKINTGSYEH